CVEYIREKLNGNDSLQLLDRQKNVTNTVYYGLPIVLKKEANIEKVIEFAQENLKMGSFQLHRMYEPLDRNPLYCPEKTLKYNQDKLRTNGLSQAQRMYNKTLVLHHSILLSNEELIDELLYILENGVKKFEI
ncbi:TPA: hypothetical protein ACL54T_002021, partial [Streptococcus pneumoniae]